MKRVAYTAGFTIVETMIVLAVTGLLFVAVATTWGGKQKNSQYLTALGSTRASIQQVISDVENGYFPASSNVRCQDISSVLKFTSVANEQGSNSGCLFLGKAVQFKNLSGDPETYQLYTVAGRSATSVSPVPPATPVDAAKPTVVPNVSETLAVPTDFETVRIKANGVINGFNGFIIMTDPGSYTGDMLNSGRQAVRLYGLKGQLGNPPLNVTPNNGFKLYAPTMRYELIDNDGMQICFKSGATRNYGLITVGANGSASDVLSETRRPVNCGLGP